MVLSRRREGLDPLSGTKQWHGHHRLTAFSLQFAITLELGLQLLAPMDHWPLFSVQKKEEMGHTRQNTSHTVLKEQTEEALSKALSVAVLMGPSQTLTTCSLFEPK